MENDDNLIANSEEVSNLNAVRVHRRTAKVPKPYFVVRGDKVCRNQEEQVLFFAVEKEAQEYAAS